ncbi:hypothetical protein Bbelb_158630 [Branchiostoma belcheri]|nr:hypothetical protein Bbelb_158630 [Branchiostoma belcheri]
MGKFALSAFPKGAHKIDDMAGFERGTSWFRAERSVWRQARKNESLTGRFAHEQPSSRPTAGDDERSWNVTDSRRFPEGRLNQSYTNCLLPTPGTIGTGRGGQDIA